MSGGWLWTGMAFGLALASQGEAGVHNYRVAIPAALTTRQTHLIIRELEVPSNRSAIFRVCIIGENGDTTYLGSTAVVAMAPKATGMTRHKLLRIDVTSGLRAWSAKRSSPDSADVRIVPKDGRGRVLTDLKWSAREVELVHPDSP